MIGEYLKEQNDWRIFKGIELEIIQGNRIGENLRE